jgi:hypothetical protein
MRLLPESAIVVFVIVKPTDKGRRKKMSKAMSEATGVHNSRVTMVIALLAMLLLLAVALVFALQPAPTTSDVNPAIHARSADVTGGSGIADDPYIERHAEVVARLGNGSLR